MKWRVMYFDGFGRHVTIAAFEERDAALVIAKELKKVKPFNEVYLAEEISLQEEEK